MSSFQDSLDQETIVASQNFIRRIKEGILEKRTLKNHYQDYPIDAASESFNAFLQTPQFDILLGKDTEEK